MNAELLKRWTEETVPALLRHWREVFSWQDLTTGWCLCAKYSELDFDINLRPNSLDSLARISELIGVVTEAHSGFGGQGRLCYGALYRLRGNNLTGWGIVKYVCDYPTEIEARLAAVIRVVAELVREEGERNG